MNFHNYNYNYLIFIINYNSIMHKIYIYYIIII